LVLRRDLAGGPQPAESLERGADNEDEYMISDRELLVNR
jgi:hypothetical protein